jgi:hypothetical protein
MLANKFFLKTGFHPMQRLLCKLKTALSANFYSEKKIPQIKKSPFLWRCQVNSLPRRVCELWLRISFMAQNRLIADVFANAHGAQINFGDLAPILNIWVSGFEYCYSRSFVESGFTYLFSYVHSVQHTRLVQPWTAACTECTPVFIPATEMQKQYRGAGYDACTWRALPCKNCLWCPPFYPPPLTHQKKLKGVCVLDEWG